MTIAIASPCNGPGRAGLAVALLALAVSCASPPAPPPGAPGAAVPPPSGDPIASSVFYEVFVRSFADSDGDGVGDFRGLTARLDELNDGDPATDDDLGIDGIWLMPVFESPSYHGYDTVDYRAIDREYGTEEDFRAFLDAAHRRGIRVVVDLMVNHTSSQHPWFEESAASPEAARRDWYVWRDDDPGWTQPWGGTNSTWHRRGDAYYYGVFWGGMPDLNFRDPEVRREMIDVARHWLAAGVDGFRLDAARHLIEDGAGPDQNDTVETLAYWREFAAAVRETRPDAILIGEVWSDTPTLARYYAPETGAGLPHLFDFALAGSIVQAVADGDATPVNETLDAIAASYPEGAAPATFLANHDMPRLATQLGGDPASLRLAPAILLTLPGTPFLYYGEEIGLPNGPGREDEWKRTPMPWTAEEPGRGFTTGTPWHRFAPADDAVRVDAQRGDPASLRSHYRDLIRLRASHPALAAGGIEIVDAGTPGMLAYRRTAPDGDVVAVHNVGTTPAAVPDSAAVDGEPLWATHGATVSSGEDGIPVVPPRTSAVWRAARR